MLPTIRKDVLPTKQHIMVVYQYVCHCDYRYVGPTSQRLQDRMKQRIPKAIRSQTQPDRDLFQSNPTSSSAKGQHLLNNGKCASYNDDNQIYILAKRRTLFHLTTLEATFIKMIKPELCRQKEFVYTLKLHQNVWLSTNQRVPTFSPTSIAINISSSTPGFILAITPEES